MAIGNEKPLTVVKGVDLKRYAGRWYQIACIPSRFQPRSGVNTRATYTLSPDKSLVHVLNETWVDGKRSFIDGRAWKADPTSDEAKLQVRFWVPPFLPVIPVTGDYWVMMLDEDYRWALVGQPSRKYLWILSREPKLDEQIYNKLLEHAESEGYNVGLVEKTTHTEGSADEQSQASTDKGGWWLKSILGK